MGAGRIVLVLLAGTVAGVLLDYASHRLMHVPFRRGPMKRMFLHHLAHHRFPDDKAILTFRPVQQMADAILAVVLAVTLGLLALAGLPLADATTTALLFVLPGFLYNRAYDGLHRRVHQGTDDWITRSRLFAVIKAHHLAHHHHRRDVAGFRRAGGYSLIFPYI
jgi:hypothetical protein